MKGIRTAIIGVGDCAGALVQGRFYYGDPGVAVPGLITQGFGEYRPRHIRFVPLANVYTAKVALVRELVWPIAEASTYPFKPPVKQYEDSVARQMLRRFALGVEATWLSTTKWRGE